MMLYPQLETVLLAAGSSSRMGATNKLLIEIDGVPLIRRSTQLYCALGMTVKLVLGHDAERIARAVAGLPLKTILNPDYASGQASSIRIGLANATLKGEALIMALGDQPLLESGDVAAICEAFLASPRDKIFLPWFENKRGNPALLPAAIARKLKTSDTLPRAYMDTNPEQVTRYAATNAHFTTDLDTPGDAARLIGG